MGRTKPQKLKSKHPEMLGGRGQGNKWAPGEAPLLGQRPSPRDEVLEPGWGPSPLHHTHTHTPTHATCILPPRCTGTPTDRHSHRGTPAEVLALARSTLRLQNVRPRRQEGAGGPPLSTYQTPSPPPQPSPPGRANTVSVQDV